MADMKDYLKEKEKRQKKQNSYKSKIRRHKLTALSRVGLVLALLAIVVALGIVQYKRHIYTGYDVVSSVERQTTESATDFRLQDAILTFSKDGAHCTDVLGNVKWNQTYEIQDMKLSVCRNAVAIGNYNGREIYMQNTEGQLGSVTTTMPLRDLTVSASGLVTAVLADTDATWINTYDQQGNTIYTGQTHMNNSGYPAALSLSPDGELLGVSYVYVDAGMIKTNVVFYNFGPVGSNQNDYIVSVYTYEDILTPEIQFINDETAFALGDSRLMIYTGEEKPVVAAEYLFQEEVQSVFYSEKYIGLVFLSETSESKYRLDVYGADAEKIGSYYFDLEYLDIFFEDGQFVAYNELECQIINFDGTEKYRGFFPKSVNLMIPTQKAYRYVLVTEESIDTVQLK